MERKVNNFDMARVRQHNILQHIIKRAWVVVADERNVLS